MDVFLCKICKKNNEFKSQKTLDTHNRKYHNIILPSNKNVLLFKNSARNIPLHLIDTNFKAGLRFFTSLYKNSS